MSVTSKTVLATLVALIAAVSCVPEGQEGEGNSECFVATAGAFPNSSGKESFLWQPGAEIAFFLGDDSRKTESAIYKTSVKKPSVEACFSAVGKDVASLSDGRYLAVFPSCAVATWAEAGKNSVYVDIPSVQTAITGSWDPSAGVMAAFSEDRELGFSHVPAYVSFSITPDSPGIVSVKVESPDGLSMADRLYVRFDRPLTVLENGSSSCKSPSVTLSAEDGRAMAEGTYYIAVTPRTYPGGLDFVFTDPAGNQFKRTVDVSLTLTSGQAISLGNIGENLFNEVFELPFSQNFYLQDAVSPLRKDLSTLKFRITAALHPVSVHLSSPGRMMAGKVVKTPEGVFSVPEGQDFISFNAMLSDGPADAAGGVLEIPVLICPGTYPEGMDVRICDLEHGVMNMKIPAFTIVAGGTKTVDVSYSRDPDVIFFDSFDLCVWGGRPGGPEGSVFRSPSGANPGTAPDPSMTGFEDAGAKVEALCPGTGLIQSETWSEVSGTTLDSCHAMSASYVRSRNFNDYTYLYRTQEYQGCVGVSMETNGRGSFRTPPFSSMPWFGSARIEFDVFASSGYADTFEVRLINGGYFSAASIDGAAFSLTAANNSYREASAYLVVPNSKIAPGGKWVHFILTAENVSDLSSVQIYPSSTRSMIHGFLLDNLKVTALAPVIRPNGGFRLLYWNIQDGMWADQGNDYATFVEWVKNFDPDVCVWCEGGSIFKTDSDDYLATADKYLPGGWPALAARYGHAYTSTGAVMNNYPQVITSRYPVTTIQQIGVPPGETQRIRSGAGMFSIDIGGRTVNFVTLHLYAQKYRPDCPEAEKTASIAAGEGAAFKAWEMGKILDLTRLNPEYSSRTDWLMMGDFNSRAPVDNWYYGLETDDIDFLPHKDIAARTDFVDVIAARYPGWFFWSNPSSRRIDMVYASPSMASRVSDAAIVIDSWANPQRSPHSADRYTPSDHRPILVDFSK